METILQSVTQRLDIFVLMLLRVTGLVVPSPVFGKKTLPNMVKVSLCLVLTYAVFAFNADMAQPAYRNMPEFALLCVKELLFGLAMGYVTDLFFSLTHIAGQYIDMQMGFGMVSVLDVKNNLSVPITGNLLNIALLIAFFGVDGHVRLIYILNRTFAQIPAGQVTLNPALGTTALELFALVFLLAAHVALPLIISGLLGEVILGVITRVMPQINVFVVGIPLKVLLGLLMLLLVLPIYMGFTKVIFDRMFSSIDLLIKGFAA